MYRDLRIRIIALTMISIALVIGAISGAINVSTYLRFVQREDAMLELISDYNGHIPAYSNELEEKIKFAVNTETPYQTRYFVIYADKNNRIIDAITSNIASVDKEDLQRLCSLTANQSDNARGTIGNYRYLVRNTSKGKMITFLDRYQDMETMMQLIMISLFTAVIGLVCILMVMIFASSRIIRPFVRNHERQKQFITDAGHELKTPLAIIRTNAEVLEYAYGKNEWLESITNQTERLDGLVKGLLQLSKSTELHAEAEHIRFSLSAAVNDIAESFKTMAEQKGHRIHFDITNGIYYKGNAQSVSTLVSILIDNAIKYASDNGEIYVTLSPMGIGTAKTARLVVANDTDLDDSVEFNRFFERFYRSDHSRARKTGGYGIGLSVAKNIVEAHKGRITVSKTDNKIAFTVIL